MVNHAPMLKHLREMRRRKLVFFLMLIPFFGLAPFVSGCGDQYGLLLTVRATHLVETFDLQIKNLATHQIVLERMGQRVDAKNPNRDISKSGQELKITLEFARAGSYLLYMVGQSSGNNRQYVIRTYEIDGVREEEMLLVPLTDDADGDGFPACGASSVNCAAMSCSFLDCNDQNKAVHPMAAEVCGNDLDDDCSAGCGAQSKEGDEPCVDGDGDGEPSPKDCDDTDPCRATKFNEAPHLCDKCPGGLAADQFPPLPQACLDRLSQQGKSLKPPYCGNGIDENCNGQDTACVVDQDCDCSPADQDCDDTNPNIHPGAQERCDDDVDNNCNNIINEGCVPCDVDGDNHASPDTTDITCDMPKDDPDDYDAGVFPGVTDDTNGAEGGSVIGAMREFCSSDPTKYQSKTHRQVDHDGDGTPAESDGCPLASCDEDGDGFAGAQCSPPKSQEDCDDKDPHVFPGAPEKCGDGTAQSCGSDIGCSCDNDGDGYCPPPADCEKNYPKEYCLAADCNDQNDQNGAIHPWAIHPWATEICDGVDNDCDGLIDEGNPDIHGNPIRTDVKLCNYSNDGLCGEPLCTPPAINCSSQGFTLSGVCACTKPELATSFGANANRMSCPDESTNLNAYSPRCFGADAPEFPERCDEEDWTCDGSTYVAGEPFLGQGNPCSIDVGNCAVGKVTTCDLEHPYSQEVMALVHQLPNHEKYEAAWKCSGSFPFSEVCNGKDDDCNGVLPAEEIDKDGDTVLPCSGCTTSDADPRKNIAAGYGCNDCDDTPGSGSTTYPGAKELCNKIDDNCADGINDDGQDECSSAETCCADHGGCKDTHTDFFNCGSCGNTCLSDRSNQCVNSSCVCGTTGSVCPAGLNCTSAGTCLCQEGGRCGGCCTGNSCVTVANLTASQCGRNGKTCQNCVDGNPCTEDLCNSTNGTCSNPPVPNGQACPGGKCYNSQCCTNCWNGSQCLGGTTSAACGQDGAICQPCYAPNDCTTASCSTGTCNISNLSNGTSCQGGTGKCRNGFCCTTCWTGSTCVSAVSTSACGDDGNLCQSCVTGETCSGGQCVCAGCYNPTKTTCYTGVTSGRCGKDGETCVDCSATGQSCNTTTRTCYCPGCWDNSTCYEGTIDEYCGKDGENCDACTGSQHCNNGDCS